MHLVVPFAAGLDEDAAQAAQVLQLPVLERLLPLLERTATVGSDEYALNLPYEHVLAQLHGWRADDGRLPFAAAAARADGLAVATGSGWGYVVPTHWQVGREQILLRDPAELAFDEAEARALFDAAQPLFTGLGWALHWATPRRWYASHPSLAQLATASLERAVGRNLDLWLPDRRAGAELRQLQSEVQMLWHTHPVNVAREQAGVLSVNSFWLWGTGAAPATAPGAAAPFEVDARLRAPWLAEDRAAWAEAWAALDAERLPPLAAHAARGDAVTLTLAGERHAHRFDTRPGQSAWRRWLQRRRRAPVAEVLAAL